MAEPIYKALTRPAMIFSVPMIPLMGASILIIFISMWANFFGLGLWGLFLLIPNYIAMRIITKFDDGMFNLLWLKFKFRSQNRNRLFHGATIYNPIAYKKREK
ncbi:type IV secretion system protein VirB3 (plasmid) [Photobacterium leiognathi subsp. mandapamensis]